jgi:tRNA threonylcarbamoyladenosine biosynthesis protein TsaE
MRSPGLFRLLVYLVTDMIREVQNEAAMKAFGRALGVLLKGGEIIELAGDVGAGKTTLTKGIADGLGVTEDVQSPSFTISRVYDARDGLVLAHYDFYRLHDAGIMADELHETLHDPKSITIVEWAGIVSGVLPDDRLSIRITPMSEISRRLRLETTNTNLKSLLEELA